MVQPHTSVCIGICAVWIFDACLDECDKAIFARWLDRKLIEVFHSVRDVHIRHLEWSICHLSSLGSLVGEKLSSQVSDVRGTKVWL